VIISVTPDNLDFLREQLGNGLAHYRSGDERAQRAGACAQLETLVRLLECVFDASGMSGAEQAELFKPIRDLHAAVRSLNDRGNPRLLRPMTVGNRRPVELPETMWRGEMAAAYELWMKGNPEKDRDVAANEIATKMGRGVRGKSIRKWHRDAKAHECPHPSLTRRFEEMLRLAEAHFPGRPAAAAEKLIEAARHEKRPW
jgi:hypothetical protein